MSSWRWWVCALVALCLGCGARVFLHMEQRPLGKGALFFEGGAGNAVALMHGRDAFLVDAKMGDFALRLQKEVEDPDEGLSRVVRRIMLTHAHSDHVLGIQRFHDVGAVLVQTNARARLEASDHAFLRAQPYTTVEDHVTLLLGGDEVRIFHPGIAHTDGDLCAFVPGRKLLIAGDVWNRGIEPEADPEYGGDVLQLSRALDRLLELDFERVIPGHGAMGTRAEVERSRDYLRAMEAAVRDAVAAGASEDEAAKQVTLAEWPAYDPVPFKANRELNVRMMYRSIVAGR